MHLLVISLLAASGASFTLDDYSGVPVDQLPLRALQFEEERLRVLPEPWAPAILFGLGLGGTVMYSAGMAAMWRQFSTVGNTQSVIEVSRGLLGIGIAASGLSFVLGASLLAYVLQKRHTGFQRRAAVRARLADVEAGRLVEVGGATPEALRDFEARYESALAVRRLIVFPIVGMVGGTAATVVGIYAAWSKWQQGSPNGNAGEVGLAVIGVNVAIISILVTVFLGPKFAANFERVRELRRQAPEDPRLEAPAPVVAPPPMPALESKRGPPPIGISYAWAF